MQKSKLLKDENYLSHFEYKNFLLILIYAGDRITCHVHIDGKPESICNDFKPGAGKEWDSWGAMCDCLGFMLLKTGDVDEEFFQDFSEVHRSFNDNSGNAEDIRQMSDNFDGTPPKPKYFRNDGQETPTTVIFRRFKDGDIIALFPYEIADKKGSISSYMQVGQHSAASYFLFHDTFPAKPEEYEGLQKELEGLGYVLDIKKRMSHEKYSKALEAARK